MVSVSVQALLSIEEVEMCLFASGFSSSPVREKLRRSVSQWCYWCVTTMQLAFATSRWVTQYVLHNWPFSSPATSRWKSIVWVHRGVSLCGTSSFQRNLPRLNSSLPLDLRANTRPGTPCLYLTTLFAFQWKKCILMMLFFPLQK